MLRQAGLVRALDPHPVVEGDDLLLPAGDPGRGADTSLINEAALLAMTDQVGQRVATAIAERRFPLLYGGDCTSLLGSIPELRRSGRLGLLFVDGHEDTMPLDVSEDGEAANTELGLLLGLTGRLMTGPLARTVGTLRRDEVALLGPRDVGVASAVQRGVAPRRRSLAAGLARRSRHGRRRRPRRPWAT